jgi:PAS domain S-box-containing protein
MKQAFERNNDTDQKLLFLVDTITEIVWEATPDGNIVYANKNWYDYIGKSPGSDITKAWLDVIHPDDKHPTNQVWQHSLKTGEPYEAELRFKEAATGIFKNA